MDGLKNKEGYTDYPAFKAQKSVDGAEIKAYYCYKTMVSVAKLAGFEIMEGNIRLKDRTGKIHHSEEVVRRREDELYRQTAESERHSD